MINVAPLICLLLPVVTIAAPVPARLTKSVYFPTTVGSKWVYDHGGDEETEEVTAIEKKDDGSMNITVRQINYLGGKKDAIFKICVEGLYQLTGGPAVKHPPMYLLKLPHKDGQTWETWMGAFGNGDTKLTAYGPETIEVPAGKYKAIRVEGLFPSKVQEGGIKAKYWYAPGVGLVKMTFGDSVRQLKSFTPGKK